MAPLLWWVRGGAGWGGRLLARPRVCAGGGGGVGGGPLAPWRCLSSAVGGGAGAAWRPWSRGPAIGQGVAPFTRPPIESWMPAQALAGALTSPAVAARRRPAGGGRGG